MTDSTNPQRMLQVLHVGFVMTFLSGTIIYMATGTRAIRQRSA